MSNQRRPSHQMPVGSSTLSDRIAALQRQASDSGKSSGRNGLSRTPSTPSYASPGPLSPSASSPSSPSIPQSQAVRDRIARFQPALGERPLIPRSSFGTPAPNPEMGSRVMRPYPGAATGGSGQWGENVMRPQMTGGAWGSEGRRTPTQGLMPQYTGPTWNRRQASAPGIQTWSATISGKDAFAELDDDEDEDQDSSSASGTSLGPHAFDVASQAAVKKGRSLPPPTMARTVSSPASTGEVNIDRIKTPPILPDPPAEEPSRGPVPEEVSSTNGSHAEVPELPSPPRAIKPEASDKAVEIELAGITPQQAQQLASRTRETSAGEEHANGAARGIAGLKLLVDDDEVKDTSAASSGLPREGSSSSSLLETSRSTGSTMNSSITSDLPSTPTSPIRDPRQAAAAAIVAGGNKSSMSTSGSTSSQDATIDSQASMMPITTTSLLPAKQRRAGGGSRSIRPPPPGKILSVADLDESDDEYEPGWASVISRVSRK